MKLSAHTRIRGEGGLAIFVILLVLVGGGVWFLYSSRASAEKDGRAFANEVVKKVAVEYDAKYLNLVLSPRAAVVCMPSCRELLARRFREFGPVTKPIETTGDIQFTNKFFEPRGTFKARMTYPTMTVTLDLLISRAISGWQIDEIIWGGWEPVPGAAATPTPAAVMAPSPSPTPTPTPTPTPAQTSSRKKKRG